MAFPTPAVNGQQYTTGGYIYQFNSTLKTWTKVGVASSSVGNVSTSNGAVTTGNTSVSPGNVSVGNTSLTGTGKVPGTKKHASFSPSGLHLSLVTFDSGDGQRRRGHCG